MKTRKARPIIWRLFHRKKRRVSGKQWRGILDAHLKIHEEMIAREQGLVVDGQFYEAAVEKFEEFMLDKAIETLGVTALGEAPLTETIIYDDIPVVRVCNIPKLLLLLGVRIR